CHTVVLLAHAPSAFSTLSLHDALPISPRRCRAHADTRGSPVTCTRDQQATHQGASAPARTQFSGPEYRRGRPATSRHHGVARPSPQSTAAGPAPRQQKVPSCSTPCLHHRISPPPPPSPAPAHPPRPQNVPSCSTLRVLSRSRDLPVQSRITADSCNSIEPPVSSSGRGRFVPCC